MGKKETLARKPNDFEKLRSPTNAASDWCGAGSADCLALETSIKPGMLLFTCVKDLVSADLWTQITNALDCSRSNFGAITRLETLAAQARLA